MRHLFIARHGDYGKGDRLNDAGKQQVHILAAAIKAQLAGDSAYLLSSTAPRALDSSEIIAAALGIPGFERMEYLWSASDAPKDTYFSDFNTGRLVQIVEERESKADALIIVSHLEIVKHLPKEMIKRRFMYNSRLDEPDYGQAVHLNFIAKSYHFLPPSHFKAFQKTPETEDIPAAPWDDDEIPF